LYASETISEGTTVSIREDGKLYYNNTHTYMYAHHIIETVISQYTCIITRITE